MNPDSEQQEDYNIGFQKFPKIMETPAFNPSSPYEVMFKRS